MESQVSRPCTRGARAGDPEKPETWGTRRREFQGSWGKGLGSSRFRRVGWSARHIIRFMTGSAHELLQKALSLPDNDRAELAGNLLASLETRHDPDVDAAWQQEVARRFHEVDSGKVKTVAWDAAFKKGQSLLDG